MKKEIDQRRLMLMIGAAVALLLIMLIVPRFKPSAHPGEDAVESPSIQSATTDSQASNEGSGFTGVTGNASLEAEPEAGGGGFSLGAGGAFSLIWRLGLVIIVIVSSIFGLRWWNQRVAGPRSATGYLRIVDTLAFQGGRSVHLVAVGERVLVVGATTNQLSFLTELEDDEAATILQHQDSSEETSVSAFAAQLFQSLKRDVPGGNTRMTVAEELE